MTKLLESRTFNHLTVNDLCNDALLSRATFYAHFNDKYDLLRYYLSVLNMELLKEGDSYEQEAESINNFMRNNQKLVKNIMDNANSETLNLINEFIVSLLGITRDENETGKLKFRHIVLENFCAGGIINLILWQVNNNFPEDYPIFNPYLNDILELLLKWEADQNKSWT